MSKARPFPKPPSKPEDREAARKRTRARQDREKEGTRKRNEERQSRPRDEFDYADKLAALMVLRGVNQSGLSRLTRGRIHQTRISRWLKRAGEPNLLQCQILSDCLRIPFSYWSPSRTDPPDLATLDRECQVEDIARRLGASVALDRMLMRATVEVHSVQPVDRSRTHGEEEAARPKLHGEKKA